MNNAKKKNSRTSVSAEVYGVFNKKSQFKPKIINKTEDQIQRIRKRLENSFMFSSLEEKEKLIVIGSFEERKFEFINNKKKKSIHFLKIINTLYLVILHIKIN